MDKKVLLKIVHQISLIIIDNCEVEEDVEQIKDGIDKCIAFIKSVRET